MLAIALPNIVMASSITITTEFSVGPVGSALVQYGANAITALETGANNVGDPGMPSYFDVANDAIYDGSIVSGGFDSWGGQPNPGYYYGAAYQNQHGQKLFGAIEVNGNGTSIDPANLQVIGSSSPLNVDLSEAYYAGQLTYGTNVVGCNKTGTVLTDCITSGPATTGRNVLFLYLPLGSAQADCTQAGSCIGYDAQAQALEAAQASIADVHSMSMSVQYCSNPATCGSTVIASAINSVAIVSSPEPGDGSLALIGICLFAISFAKRQ
jgi:hypothetical protein